MVQVQSQEGGNSFHDARIGAASSTSAGSYKTTPYPLCPPTPPGTAHIFPEPQDTTGQARRKANTGLSTHKGPQVLCKILSVSAPTTTLITSSTISLTTTSATTFTINSPTVLSALTPSTSSANMMVNDSCPFSSKIWCDLLVCRKFNRRLK